MTKTLKRIQLKKAWPLNEMPPKDATFSRVLFPTATEPQIVELEMMEEIPKKILIPVGATIKEAFQIIHDVCQTDLTPEELAAFENHPSTWRYGNNKLVHPNRKTIKVWEALGDHNWFESINPSTKPNHWQICCGS